jgi:adenylyltransferase/sulfurtransferase
VGGGSPLIDRLWTVDSWRMRFREIALSKDPSCPLCGERPSITGLVDYEAFCGIGVRTEPGRAAAITAVALKARLDRGDALRIIDIRMPHERTMGSLPGSVSIPLPRLIGHMEKLNPAEETVLVCKKGENSELAAIALREQGYTGRLLNLVGGMNAWAREADPSIPVY